MLTESWYTNSSPRSLRLRCAKNQWQGARSGKYDGCGKTVTFSDFRDYLTIYVMEHFHAVEKHVGILSLDVALDFRGQIYFNIAFVLQDE